jgi:mitochondrial fission protein ELM1
MIEFIQSRTLQMPPVGMFAVGMASMVLVPKLSRRAGLPDVVGLLLPRKRATDFDAGVEAARHQHLHLQCRQPPGRGGAALRACGIRIAGHIDRHLG